MGVRYTAGIFASQAIRVTPRIWSFTPGFVSRNCARGVYYAIKPRLMTGCENSLWPMGHPRSITGIDRRQGIGNSRELFIGEWLFTTWSYDNKQAEDRYLPLRGSVVDVSPITETVAIHKLVVYARRTINGASS